MTTESQYIEDGEGKPIVFFHAFPLSAEQWTNQIAMFSREYRCIAIDLSGLLANTPSIEPSMMQIAAQCRSLLNSLQVGSFVLAGCSLGGYLAMAMLRQYPNDIRGLVLSNTRAAADTPEAITNRQRQISLIRAEGKAPVLAELLPKLLAASSRERDASLDPRITEMSEHVSETSMMQLLHSMAQRPDSTDLLAETPLAVCVISGQLDVLMPAAELEIMASKIQNSEYHCIDGAGHLPNLEMPDEFNLILQRFLEKICY